ncbi:expressed unknown protein [Seminavis robusta]|uniref:Uncharacterized protein n=1 Tax=Seminavis robusta TaxID=568900 RepID=A0A9N8DSY2_9STRA|nr:expressed unknown protein [Seminavis robusta]|eukprot:Sro333_g119520.1 n/a (285) ;mRNA; f:33652-34631
MSSSSLASLQLKLALQLHAIKKSISNLGKTPVSKDDRGQVHVDGEDTDEAVMAASPSIIHVIAAVAMISGAVTGYLYSWYLIEFAAFCLLIISPVVAVQKVKLQLLGDIRGQHNGLRSKCNVLLTENDKLKGTVQEMKTQTDRLSQVEEGLSKIAEESNTEVARLVEIVKETKTLQTQIKKSLERQVMQQIISAVVASDQDGNFSLSPRETNILKARLKQIDGVNLNEEKFYQMIAADDNELTVQDVMKIVRNLLDDSVPAEDNVFVLEPQSLSQNKSIPFLPW